MAQPWMPEIYGIPIQVLMIWFLFAWLILFHFSSFIKSISIFSHFQWLAIGVLAGIIFLRSALDGWNMLHFGQLMTGIMIALLGSIVFLRKGGIKIILTLLSFGVMVSCLFCILQYFNFSSWVWQASRYKNTGYIYGSTGLEFSPVSFGYSVIGISMILIGSCLLYLRYHINLVPLKLKFMFLIGVLIITGIIFSNSRSSMFGMCLGIVVLRLAKRPIRKSQQFAKERNPDLQSLSLSLRNTKLFRNFFAWQIVIIIISSLFIYGFTIREGITEDVRIYLTWHAYLPIILKNPMGFGEVEFRKKIEMAETNEYLTELKIKMERLIAPHNLFLTTGVTYGLLAALSLLFFYGSIFINGMRTYSKLRQSGNTRAALWILLLISVNLAIFIHSFFHNASIAIGEMRNWLWIGALATYTSIYKKLHNLPKLVC